MTKCNMREVNLKSTAYNQDGQNYFQQLTIYNSMSAHLRRVLLAKCVVDAGNRAYMRKKKQLCKPNCKQRYVQTDSCTNNFIDKLAYDTLHHPADFLRMNYDSKYCYPCEAEKHFSSNYDYDLTSRTKLRSPAIRPGPFKTNNSEQYSLNCKSTARRPYTQSNTSSRKVFKSQDTRNAMKVQDRYEEISMSYESSSESLSQDTNRLSSPPIYTSKSSEDHEIEVAASIDAKKVFAQPDDTEYVKFVYEITRDIILNGLYTDEELQIVFSTHIEKNRAALNMNRMLYEIYQLKIALNMTDENDDDDLEDIVYSEYMRTSCKFRPPTPPKTLNSERVLEKLKYQQVDEARRMSIDSHRAVVLVDANPEIRVTERNVLTSLLEANISPEKANEIYKKIVLVSDEVHPSLIGKNEESNDESEMELSNHMTSHEVKKMNEQEGIFANDDVTAREHQNLQV
ncbi:uncharacterized protein LOC108627010 [Ceratina calcarata]|uniref:Uncharacterized protein LOC108627010 n=1 Tax=Ceratina calcarata TaxID=156304 RepID=A0AAJ7J3Q8_9HYME|nr:uncharacterized protein LOC108627010 [Ceratina calcarata]XP_017883506.1 uncharacterized protein LOC108627010 [Ceratina calcarata]